MNLYYDSKSNLIEEFDYTSWFDTLTADDPENEVGEPMCGDSVELGSEDNTSSSFVENYSNIYNHLPTSFHSPTYEGSPSSPQNDSLLLLENSFPFSHPPLSPFSSQLSGSATCDITLFTNQYNLSPLSLSNESLRSNSTPTSTSSQNLGHHFSAQIFDSIASSSYHQNPIVDSTLFSTSFDNQDQFQLYSNPYPNNTPLNSSSHSSFLPQSNINSSEPPPPSFVDFFSTSTPALPNSLSNQPFLHSTYDRTLHAHTSSSTAHSYRPIPLKSTAFSGFDYTEASNSNYFPSQFDFNNDFSPLASTISPLSSNQDEEEVMRDEVGSVGRKSTGKSRNRRGSTSKGILNVSDERKEDNPLFGVFKLEKEVYDANGNIVDLQPSIQTNSFTFNKSINLWICYRRNQLSFTNSIIVPQFISPLNLFLSVSSNSNLNSDEDKFKKIKKIQIELHSTIPTSTSSKVVTSSSSNKKKSNSGSTTTKNSNRANLLQFSLTNRAFASAIPIEPKILDLNSSSQIEHEEIDKNGQWIKKGGGTLFKTTWNRIQFTSSTLGNNSKKKGEEDIDFYTIRVKMFALVEKDRGRVSLLRSEVETSDEGEGDVEFEKIRIGSWKSGGIVVRGRSPKGFVEKEKKIEEEGKEKVIGEQDEVEMVDFEIQEVEGEKKKSEPTRKRGRPKCK